MNVLKILLVVMVLMSAFAFTEGCVDKTEDLPDTDITDINDIDETIVEPDVEITDVPEEDSTEIVVEDTTSVLPEREPKTEIVWIRSYFLSPREREIYVGDSINWINDETRSISYKLISEDGLWEDKTLGRGSKFSYTFNESGIYNYSCTGGANLQGSVTVVEYNETTAGLYDSTLKKGVVSVE